MRIHPSKYEELASGIRTFNEQVEDDELINRVHKEVEDCNRAIFLGFHFYKQNTDFLTPKSLLPLDGNRARRLCYGTATGRSGPDVNVIHDRIVKMFHQQTQELNFGSGWDCKAIFKTFATTWGA